MHTRFETFYKPASSYQWRRHSLLPGLICLVGFCAFQADGVAENSLTARPPHVIVILADDAGWGDFSFVGNPNLSTPAIDSLARDGAVLETFLVQPVCAPTRAELLTGRYHSRGGVRGVTNGKERLAASEKTIADIFQAAGYATGLFGKWHNGTQWPYHPLARGFEHFYGFTEGHWGDYFDPPMQENTEFVTGSGFITNDITDKAITFLKPRLSNSKARPAFCLISFNTPHSPMCVPDANFNRFADRKLQKRGPRPEMEDEEFSRAALAMIENLDHNVGRILATVNAADASRDTIVVFFSDNGPNNARWCGGMRGRKGSTDDGGVRSVCCIRFPRRINASSALPQITGAIDLLPSLAGLAGIPLTSPKPLDGINLTPLLIGSTESSSLQQARKTQLDGRHIIATHRGRISVRTNHHRLDHEGRLYDMQADPSQTEDVTKQYPAEAARLQQIAADFQKTVLDTLPHTALERFPVGATGAPLTELPARDGHGIGGVVRSGKAPNCSHFTNWSTPGDKIVWDVEIQTPGRYAAELWYTCPATDIGSTVALSCGDSRTTATIKPTWDPPLNTDDDRVPRKSESFTKPFKILSLGELDLSAGASQLQLQALHIPGKSVADVRRLILRPLASPAQ